MDASQASREIKKDEEIIEKTERDIDSLDNKIAILERSKSEKETELKAAEAEVLKAKEELSGLMKKINDIRQTLLPKDTREMKTLTEEKERKKALVIKIQTELEDVKRQLDDAVNKQKNA